MALRDDQDGRSQTSKKRLVMLCLFGLCIAVASVPILLVEIPPLYDYYFHMARFKILEDPSAEYIRDFYAVAWPAIPNLAMDLIMWKLVGVLSVEAASRLFLVICFFVLLSGTVALHCAIHRKGYFWPLFSSLFLYNWIFIFGFANYIFGIGLMLWCLASWIYCRRYCSLVGGWLVLTAMATVLYFAHFYVLALFGIMVLSFEIGFLCTARRFRLADLTKRLTAIAPPFLVPLALLIASSTASEHGDQLYFHPEYKVLAVDTLMTGGGVADLVFYAVLALLGAVLLWRRWLRIAPAAVVPVVVLAVLYAALPFTALGSHFVDLRLPMAALFILTAVTRLEGGSRSQFLAFGGAVAGVFVVRVAFIAMNWVQADAQIAEYRAVYRQLTPGSALFSAAVNTDYKSPHAWPEYWRMPVEHIASLALLSQPVFVAQLYLERGQQPVEVTGRYRPVAAFQRQRGGNHSRGLVRNREELQAWLASAAAVAAGVPNGFRAIYASIADPARILLPPPANSRLVFEGKDIYVLEMTRHGGEIARGP
jgi:hypothetical protein